MGLVRGLLVLGAALALSAPPALAQGVISLESAVKSCRLVPSREARLDCYDAVIDEAAALASGRPQAQARPDYVPKSGPAPATPNASRPAQVAKQQSGATSISPPTQGSGQIVINGVIQRPAVAPAPVAPVTATAPTPTTTVADPAPAPATTMPARATASVTAAAPPAPEPERRGIVGRVLGSGRDDGAVEIASARLTPFGKVAMVMTSGEVWEQTDATEISDLPRVGDMMTFTRSVFGKYTCKPESTDRFDCTPKE